VTFPPSPLARFLRFPSVPVGFSSFGLPLVAASHSISSIASMSDILEYPDVVAPKEGRGVTVRLAGTKSPPEPGAKVEHPSYNPTRPICTCTSRARKPGNNIKNRHLSPTFVLKHSDHSQYASNQPSVVSWVVPLGSHLALHQRSGPGWEVQRAS
jgi:hypothetical protein